MDLESECLAIDSGEDHDVFSSERMVNVEGNKIESNGSCGSEHKYDHFLTITKSEDIEVNSSEGSSPPVTTKGYGLKKWRRIRREFSKDWSGTLDPSKILKRGLSTSAANSTRHQGLSVETRRKSDSFLLSTEETVYNLVFGSSSESRLPVVGTDSENSEDTSSKSSTAASVPKSRYEVSLVVGNPRDKNRVKSSSGKNIVNFGQTGEKGKNRTEASKKPRGERVKIEKENSHCSVESDSQSSNFFFVQGADSVTSNGRQSGRSMNCDGENSNEDRGGEPYYVEELRTGYNSKQNAGELDLSQENLVHGSWEVKGEKVEIHTSSTDIDLVVDSIFTLKSAQEALEREVQKLREIGQSSLCDSSTRASDLPSEFAAIDPKTHEASSSDLLHSGDITENSSHFSKTQVTSSKQSINLLESNLDEANAVLKAKDANEFPKEEMSTIESQQKQYREMEAELEGLFKQKIEVEIEYLAISRTIPQVRVAAVDQVATGQPQHYNEIGDAESKSERLKRQAEKVETCYADIVETDQVLKLQTRVCKVTSCFFAQTMLLFVAFVLFLLQLSPHYAGVVPT